MYIFKTLCDSAKPWQYGYQDPATPIIRGIIHLHNNIIFYLIIILCFVCMLLFRAIFKFRAEINKFCYKDFIHSTPLETGLMFTVFFSLILFTISNGIIFGGPMACCESGGLPINKTDETISDFSSVGDPTTHKSIETAKLRSQAMKDFFLYAETIGLIEELKSLILLIESGHYTKENNPLIFDLQSRGKDKLDPSDIKTKDDLDKYYEQEIARLESEKNLKSKNNVD